MAHAGGRPLKYKTVKALKEAIDKYFNDEKEGALKKDKQPIFTMSGLAYAIGLDRKSLINYSNRDEFFPAIKDARERVEQQMEHNMLSGSGSTTGYIFSFKNNFGWNDKNEVELTGKDGGAIEIKQLEKMTDEQLLAIATGSGKDTVKT